MPGATFEVGIENNADIIAADRPVEFGRDDEMTYHLLLSVAI